MTTWSHTGTQSRLQWSQPCPVCKRVWRRTVSSTVVDWLDANPDECLTVPDIAAKWDMPLRTAHDAMVSAERRGLVRRVVTKRGEFAQWWGARPNVTLGHPTRPKSPVGSMGGAG